MVLQTQDVEGRNLVIIVVGIEMSGEEASKLNQSVQTLGEREACTVVTSKPDTIGTV